MNPTTGLIDDDWLLDRALGACVGACIGDASGAPLEKLRAGRPPTESEVAAAMTLLPSSLRTASLVRPGGITDDGEMTVSLSNAFAEMAASETEPGFELEIVAKHYGRWVQTAPPDMGLTVGASIGVARSTQKSFLDVIAREGLALQMQRGAAFEAKMAAPSKSNGQLMRTAPIAVFGHRLDDDALFELVKADCSLSHIAPVCADASMAYCVALRELLRRPDATGAEAFEAARVWTEAHAGDELKQWMAAVVAGAECPAWPNAGFVKVAWSIALAHLKRFDSAAPLSEHTYNDVLRAVLLAGGDADTNACIAGALIGALVGFNRLPAASKARVLGHKSQRPEFLHASTLLETVPAMLRRAPKKDYRSLT